MNGSAELDDLFRSAVAAMDAGDVLAIDRLTRDHPVLLRERLIQPGAWLRDRVADALGGFFKDPYLLWFVAEDPVRNDVLPQNIAQVASTIVAAAQREKVASLQEQLDYALRLVAWSWVADRCGVQLALIDVLVDAGAATDGVPDSALVNGHVAAAQRLLQRGAPLTLAAALCVGCWDPLPALADRTSRREKQMALTLAALNGKDEGLSRLLALGDVDVNAPSQDLYSHASPLHHAVCSSALAAVKVLVAAGADLGSRDSAHGATPLDWARYYMSEPKDDAAALRYAAIAQYLQERNA